MLTPPSTTMVITSSSHPVAIVGRVEPIREVRRIDATPLISPVSTNRRKRMRSTCTPENCAAIGLLPMA